MNEKENLWGGLQALPSLQHCTTTCGEAKFHCSVDKIELANQLVYLSSEMKDEKSDEHPETEKNTILPKAEKYTTETPIEEIRALLISNGVKLMSGNEKNA